MISPVKTLTYFQTTKDNPIQAIYKIMVKTLSGKCNATTIMAK